MSGLNHIMMEHKAFVFSYQSFLTGLAPVLDAALRSGDTRDLAAFIDANLDTACDPDEGEPLPSDWRENLTADDAHELGDIALTLYYDPIEDIGLGYEWNEIDDLLNDTFPDYAAIVLGSPFGPETNYFDPGKMGSYFQPPDQVSLNLRRVEEIILESPAQSQLLRPVAKMLKEANEKSQGLYVTF